MTSAADNERHFDLDHITCPRCHRTVVQSQASLTRSGGRIQWQCNDCAHDNSPEYQRFMAAMRGGKE